MRVKFFLYLVLSFSLLISCNPEVKKMNLTKNKYPENVKNSVIYEVNIRQYTEEGTLNAFEQHLPRLEKLGVDILWLMPVFPVGELNRKGSLGSYYSISNYTEINSEFGTKEDFKNLVESAHKRGMLVILDWVANHTSFDNIWAKENPEWYTQDDNGNIISPNPDWSDVADLNYNNKDMRNAMVDAMKYWVENFDVDGFRCDVAFMVPTDFWDSARVELEKVKPMFMLAEAEQPDLMNKAFDMYYSWDLFHLMNDIAAGNKNAAEVINYINADSAKFPNRSFRMTFTTNHDENSWNGTVFTRMADSYKIFAALTYTLPGMPLIYSGQEVGLDKSIRFFDKDTIDWKDSELTAFYQKLNKLKHDYSALGNFKFASPMIYVETNDEQNILAFVRKNKNDNILCIFNLSAKPIDFYITDEKYFGKYKNYMSNSDCEISDSSFHLEAWNFKILVK